MSALADRSTDAGSGDRQPPTIRVKQLTLVHGKLVDGRPTVVLGYEPLVVGRDARRGGIGLADPEVSRKHAVVSLDEATQTWWIADQDSRNGVYVNGQRVERAALVPGSVIRIGKNVLLYDEAELDTEHPLRPEAPPLLGPSAAMQRVRGEIELVAPRGVSVLILGETGVGKELVAQEVHRRSGRRGRFVPVNCAAIPPTLAESELFGHSGGAFSGAATHGAEGLFSSAAGGTLFLDEVGELPLLLQPKLLRALATGEIRPVGASDARVVDVRVVAATNRELAAQVADGTFRADLYSRLVGWTIRVPPLRARREDILSLANAILRRAGGAVVPSTDVAEALLLHTWPYNVRELEQVLATAAARVVGGGWQLLCHHLPPELTAIVTGRTTAAPPSEADARPLPSLVQRDATPTREELGLVLERLEGNVVAVAAYFGKDRRQIYRWARSAGLDLKTFRSRGS